MDGSGGVGNERASEIAACSRPVRGDHGRAITARSWSDTA